MDAALEKSWKAQVNIARASYIVGERPNSAGFANLIPGQRIPMVYAKPVKPRTM